MISGGGQSSKGSGSTGQTTSLSFVPALLSNAFFGSGIGIDDGGFSILGTRDFTGTGKAKKGASALYDPFGLNQILSTNPFSQFTGGGNSAGVGGGVDNFGGNFGGNTFGGVFGPGGATPGSPFADALNGVSNSGLSSYSPLLGLGTPQGSSGGGGALNGILSMGGNPMGDLMAGISSADPTGFMSSIFGGKKEKSPQEMAQERVASLLGRSPQQLGIQGQQGALNPFGLVSNLLDLADPAINPGIGAGLQGLAAGKIGSQLGNELLFGDIGPTLQEGLRTGFKPDLEPVIQEAGRRFFGEIVPQLGQQNVAMQEGVGPFSTDLQSSLLTAGTDLSSQLGALEVQNQNLAADRRGEFLGLSPLITDQLLNAPVNAGRNAINLGEQLALSGTRGGRQATLLQLLSGQMPAGPIQGSSSQNSSKGAQGGIFA